MQVRDRTAKWFKKKKNPGRIFSLLKAADALWALRREPWLFCRGPESSAYKQSHDSRVVVSHSVWSRDSTFI